MMLSSRARRACTHRLWGAGVVVLLFSFGAHAQDLGNFEVYPFNFNRPIFFGAPPGEPERILVGELRGTIQVIENGVRLPTPFLDIRTRLRTDPGLVGIAFPPDYATSRRFYVNYTPADEGPVRIARYTTSDNPNVANTTEELVLETGNGGGDHVAGWMEFGPDGNLYIARGNAAGEPGGNDETSQDPEAIQGKILRIDVSPEVGYAIPPDNPFVGVPGRDEVAVIGLRNPWRDGFDRLTGDLYISDVGNMTMEETTMLPAGGILGRNLGWPCMEGTLCRLDEPPCVCTTPPMTPPTHAYGRSEGSWIIGGTVYRGAAIPRWRGRYFYVDGGSSRIWSFRTINGVMTDLQDHTTDLIEGFSPPSRMTLPISFGADADGELYILEYGGRVYRIAPEFAPADWDLDGVVNSADFFAFLVDFFELDADLTGDHATTSADFFEYLQYFFAS